jgi:hypothetical protein
MNKLARALLSVLLLAAVGLTAGCGGISSDKLNTDQFWEKLAREGNQQAALALSRLCASAKGGPVDSPNGDPGRSV